jgi:hypothetical protein
LSDENITNWWDQFVNKRLKFDSKLCPIRTWRTEDLWRESCTNNDSCSHYHLRINESVGHSIGIFRKDFRGILRRHFVICYLLHPKFLPRFVQSWRIINSEISLENFDRCWVNLRAPYHSIFLHSVFRNSTRNRIHNRGPHRPSEGYICQYTFGQRVWALLREKWLFTHVFHVKSNILSDWVDIRSRPFTLVLWTFCKSWRRKSGECYGCTLKVYPYILGQMSFICCIGHFVDTIISIVVILRLVID